MAETSLQLPESYVTSEEGAPQGFIRGVGKKITTDDWGFELGDRVVLSGNYTPLPEVTTESERPLILVEPHQIKAVLVEG